jgi:hypothetical protein
LLVARTPREHHINYSHAKTGLNGSKFRSIFPQSFVCVLKIAPSQMTGGK